MTGERGDVGGGGEAVLQGKSARRLLRLSAGTLVAAVVFAAFFQVNKQPPFREINPFLVDPYDAVGSIAVQAALGFALLSLARAVRLSAEQKPAEVRWRSRLVLRGDRLTMLAMLVTLISDCIAMIVSPVPHSLWGDLLVGQLGFMVLVVSAFLVWLAIVTGRTPTMALPPDLTPADAIDDLWSLIRVPVERARRRRSPRPGPVSRFTSDRLFAGVPGIDPRRHPWRFTGLVGVLAGLLLLLGQLREGLPPTPMTGLVVSAIFIPAEAAAMLLGLATLGGYVGLRPSFRRPSGPLEAPPGQPPAPGGS